MENRLESVHGKIPQTDYDFVFGMSDDEEEEEGAKADEKDD